MQVSSNVIGIGTQNVILNGGKGDRTLWKGGYANEKTEGSYRQSPCERFPSTTTSSSISSYTSTPLFYPTSMHHR